jgi:hypothetical protein
MQTTSPVIYQSMVDVQKQMSQFGIAKNSNNQQQKYKFRGIDDVLNALSPLLSENNIIITPSVKERIVTERASRNGGLLFYVTVCVDYIFTSSADGSKHTVTTYGEAMDSGDKATNKAMSAAYKYMAIQAFCIPVQGTPDADFTSHDIVSQAQSYLDQLDNCKDASCLSKVSTMIKNDRTLKETEITVLRGKYMSLTKRLGAH